MPIIETWANIFLTCQVLEAVRRPKKHEGVDFLKTKKALSGSNQIKAIHSGRMGSQGFSNGV